MDLRFWGCRGSLPASITTDMIREKLKQAVSVMLDEGIDKNTDLDTFIDEKLPFWMAGTYGTNTSCVEISTGQDYILCDAGSGLRDFGNWIMTNSGPAPHTFHIFLSHPHWDHIQGFPFFVPAYIAGNRIIIYGCHDNLHTVFDVQQSSPFFPVLFGDLGADIQFVKLSPGESFEIAGCNVKTIEQRHPGLSYGYRFERNNKAIVYSTDCEHKQEAEIGESPHIEFFKNADLLIFDAQYSYGDACTLKEEWGHSNNILGVEMAKTARVKRLCLFHLEPTVDDRVLDRVLHDTQRYSQLFDATVPLEIYMAREGLTFSL